MRARKLPQNNSDIGGQGRNPRRGIGARLTRRQVTGTLAGGVIWFSLAHLAANHFQLSLGGFVVLEAAYVAGVTVAFLCMEEPPEEPTMGAKDSSRQVVRCLAQVAALHDNATAQHCERIGALAYALAFEMGLPDLACETLRDAAVLHDLGKIGIDRTILLKPGPLSDEERREVRRHVELGASLLDGADHPVLDMAKVAITSHHEWWDGRGYPRGLAGEAIPVEGRIVAVCDVFDALATERPYREAMPPHAALDLLRESSGIQFDPTIVAAFERCYPRLLEIYAG